MVEKRDRKAYLKAYDESHKEQSKVYRESHREQLKEQRKAYYEAHKKRSKAYREAHRKPGKHKPHLTDDQILKTYYDNPGNTWAQLAEKLGISESYTKTRIGFALMQECRESPACPMKALLPEYEENTP